MMTIEIRKSRRTGRFYLNAEFVIPNTDAVWVVSSNEYISEFSARTLGIDDVAKQYIELMNASMMVDAFLDEPHWLGIDVEL